MQKIIYNKPALNVDEQIELLKSRGLIINNAEFAKQILSNITYYRLSCYMKYFQIDKDEYTKNVKFEDIVELYNFDEELRDLIFKYIKIIEISIRAKISLHMCSNYGSHWFFDENNFKTVRHYNKTLEILENEKGLQKDTFIKYYFKKYCEPKLPPFWEMSEVLSMGDLSKILSSLNFKDIKQISKSISPNYFIAPVLTNWIHAIAAVRNICAHHSRLWNRQLKIQFSKPNKIAKWDENNIKHNKVNAVCFVISLLLENHPYNNFDVELKELFEKYKNIDKSKMR